MNFLSHDRLLGAARPSLAHVGAALPDLWPLLPVRPLPLVVLRRLRGSDEPGAAALAWGIAHHMHADAVFHRHPEFEARTARAAAALRARAPRLRHAGLAAHVLVEMLLDRWIIGCERGVVDGYYAHFSPEGRRRAAALTSGEPAVRDDLGGLLDRFAGSRFLEDYDRFDGIALRLERTLRRVGIVAGDVDRPALAAVAAGLHDELAPGSEALLADVSARVDASLAAAGLPPPS